MRYRIHTLIYGQRDRNHWPKVHERGSSWLIEQYGQRNRGFPGGIMAWVRIAGIKGRFYEPDPQPSWHRKHHCEDCHYCQNCSNTRCAVCRQEGDAAVRISMFTSFPQPNPPPYVRDRSHTSRHTCPSSQSTHHGYRVRRSCPHPPPRCDSPAWPLPGGGQ